MKKINRVTTNGRIVAHGRTYSPESYERFKKYQRKYDKEKYRRFIVRISKYKESNIIDWLESKENFNQYIKTLIKNDMTSYNS